MDFASIAWFALNKTVGANTMAIGAKGSDFELATEGYYGYYDDYLPQEYTKIDTDLEHAGSPTSGTHGRLTTNQGSSIQWLVESDRNAKNYVTSSTKENEKGIRPGTSGELKFWVVPKNASTINISFKLTLEPYKANYRLTADNKFEVDENNMPIELAPTSVADDSDYAEVMDYIKSHILFFKKRNTVGTGASAYYTYSDLIPVNTEFDLVYDSVSGTYKKELVFTVDDGDLQDKEFSIYWVWPETLAEAVLPENKQNTGKHCICPNNEIFNELKKDPSKFLKEYDASKDTNNTADSALTQDLIYQYYSRLSIEYNNADQDIGDNIGYLLLELSASG